MSSGNLPVSVSGVAETIGMLPVSLKLLGSWGRDLLECSDGPVATPPWDSPLPHEQALSKKLTSHSLAGRA